MNLGVVEDLLLATLRQTLGPDVELRAGPPHGGPATGLRAQVFVCTAFLDLGDALAPPSRVSRQALQLPRGVQGFSEQRPARLDVDVHCLCAQPAQAQQLAGQVALPLLQALQSMAPPLLSPPADRLRSLRLADFRVHVQAQSSQRLEHLGVAAAQVVLSLRVDGFLHWQLAAPGGLKPPEQPPLQLQMLIDADPAGTDLGREHVQLLNAGKSPIDLSGWSLHDAARRPHTYRFADDVQLLPGAPLRLWTGRGRDDRQNLHWGRRAAVWNNTGDVAVLRDAEGRERARASWSPPLPVPPEPAAKRTRKTAPAPAAVKRGTQPAATGKAKTGTPPTAKRSRSR